MSGRDEMCNCLLVTMVMSIVTGTLIYRKLINGRSIQQFVIIFVLSFCLRITIHKLVVLLIYYSIDLKPCLSF